MSDHETSSFSPVTLKVILALAYNVPMCIILLIIAYNVPMCNIINISIQCTDVYNIINNSIQCTDVYNIKKTKKTKQNLLQFSV